MKIAVFSPHSTRNGNTVSSILLGLSLAETKRKTFLTHVKPRSKAIHNYLGFVNFADKTSTPTQLVKLMRSGAIKPEEITDYCKTYEDFLDVFANDNSAFSNQDMHILLEFLVQSDTNYEYMVFDVDAPLEDPSTQLVLSNVDIVILNVSSDATELDYLNDMREEVMKVCRGKKVILLCSAYDFRGFKSVKDITKYLNMDTHCYSIRHNSWILWACNNGKLDSLFKQGKGKNPALVDIYKDAASLQSAVIKTKVTINKARKGVFK